MAEPEIGLRCYRGVAADQGGADHRSLPEPAANRVAAPPEAMLWVPGGRFLMGSNDFYREERPARGETVAGFRMDRDPVTNAAFRAFVEATGYVTAPERMPDPALYPDADPSLLAPGSLVFTRPAHPVRLHDHRAWWSYVLGADWRHPEGPGSDLDGLDDHPVVHVAYEDACAYAAWAGKELPTEAEWEFAARGGLDGAAYAWGEAPSSEGRAMANTWQGRFPWENLGIDGYEGTSPVGAFPANGYGLRDMIGNVWEWTASPFAPSHDVGRRKSCCVPSASGEHLTRYVVKGGSHLCAPNYCLRYRPAARQGEPADTSTCHVGFRCVVRSGMRPV